MPFSCIKVHWNNAKEYLIVIISKGKLDLVLQKANIRCPKSLLQTTELHIILIDTCPTLRSPNRTVHEGNNSVYLFPNWAFVLFRMSTLHLESIRLFHIFRYLLEEKEIDDEFFWWNMLRRKKKSREVMGTWWMQRQPRVIDCGLFEILLVSDFLFVFGKNKCCQLWFFLPNTFC